MLALDTMDNVELGHYLAAQGVLADSALLTVEALGGGVSNIVLRVTTPAQCWVLKQALPELRVAAYWPSRIDRAVREAEALRVVSGHLPSGAVPTVHFIDEENYIYGMSCAPDSATLWKENLLAGEVELPVAAAAGRVLAQMHAIQDPAVRERFIDDEVFWQLRVDPYYNTIAEKYPSVKPVVARAIAQMKARKLALVHGDYSPKNMFVLREKMDSRASGNGGQRGWAECRTISSTGQAVRGNDGEGTTVDSRSRGNDAGQTIPRETTRAVNPSAGCKPALPEETASLPSSDGRHMGSILLLDFEVVHWGDPAFDLAFCINHLLIKSIVNAHVQATYFQAVSAMLEAYRDELPAIDWAELLAETRLQLGCLMLARIDGKSPVEYITDEPTKETVRRVSRFILHEQSASISDIYACIAREAAH